MDFEIPRDVHQLADQDRYGELAIDFDGEEYDEEQVQQQANGADPLGCRVSLFARRHAPCRRRNVSLDK
jgi:hypothetical protein